MNTEKESMKIRQVTEADWSEWRRMRVALWPDEEETTEAEMTAWSARPDLRTTLVIERPDGRLGGFLEVGTRDWACGCQSSPVGYIEGWYVDDDLRRQGQGRALVRAAEQWARERGLQEMGSDAVLDNEVSIAAHQALGYTECDRVVQFSRRLD
jgi:aminoglycoside 6'-N-acetyltransferase I